MNLELTSTRQVSSISKTDRLVGFGFPNIIRQFSLHPLRSFPVATVFYQNDANPSALKGKTIAVFGYGSQDTHRRRTSATADTKLSSVSIPSAARPSRRVPTA